MDRYSSYGQHDDPALQGGDTFLIGVNNFDAPENLSPGQCQAATNIDFEKATGPTRGGLVCVPSLGNAPFDAAATWISRTSAADLLFRGICFGSGRFVAVAQTSPSGAVMYSLDAITWTLGVHPLGNTSQWSSIAFGDGKFVAVSNASETDNVMYSTDGATWTAVASGHSDTWTSITYSATDNQFVAVADSGANLVMTSPDGITWTARAAASLSATWTAVTYAVGLYVAVASSGEAMTSPDGITWTLRTSVAGIWSSVTHGGATFVAVGLLGEAMTSPDGLNWTSRTTLGPDQWRCVCYGNSLFVAVADSAPRRVMTSPDGVTWTEKTAAANNQWRSVTNAMNTFVAVSSSGAGNRVMTAGATSAVFGAGLYSPLNLPAENWVVLAGRNSAAFYAFGREAREIDYPASYTIDELSTVVQAGNYLFIFSGADNTPIRWNGNWSGDFELVPDSTAGAGFESIPHTNQATYYQNRLWPINGKDDIAASDVLDFTEYDLLANDFNLNTGSSDYLIKSHPFGDNGLVVFKNRSSILLQNVQGGLGDVTATEITRELGIIGINASVTVGPDLVYMSDRNITTVRLNLQNQLQAVTEPLSRNITATLRRVNWAYAYKVSMGYWNNHLFVAVPLDSSTVCDTILVYNFITKQWYGEWTFSANLGMPVVGFVVANYFGENRLHVITEDGRVFVTNEGQNDISGTNVFEIESSLTSRPYRMNNENRVNRRMFIDASANRPKYSITAYVEGASESEEILTDQEYSRADSWIFNDAPYDLTNANDDYNRAFRQDYSSGPNSVESGSGFQPEMRQSFRLPVLTRRKGRLAWLKIDNAQGFLEINGVGFEARAGDRSSLIQV